GVIIRRALRLIPCNSVTPSCSNQKKPATAMPEISLLTLHFSSLCLMHCGRPRAVGLDEISARQIRIRRNDYPGLTKESGHIL
ncbi:hypothetical protein, partial [Erwinia billingiae]|uniref:hypothetical protein n=1 Tax=Erwinia billingiae TaxID=182337 RepID=UPI001A7ED15F